MTNLDTAKTATAKKLTKKLITPGIYRHYKGGEYQVIDTATHSETEELLVLYRPLYGESALWVRPIEMFNQPVNYQGQMQPRFQLITKAP